MIRTLKAWLSRFKAWFYAQRLTPEQVDAEVDEYVRRESGSKPEKQNEEG